MAVKFNRQFNVNRLIKRIMYLIVGLLVGGLILSAFVNAFRGYCSVLFNGLSILGVNITTGTIYNQTVPTLQSGCSTSSYVIGASGNLNSGILTVVGVIGVAGIVMGEFVRW
jgi:hypothetical protein